MYWQASGADIDELLSTLWDALRTVREIICSFQLTADVRSQAAEISSLRDQVHQPQPSLATLSYTFDESSLTHTHRFNGHFPGKNGLASCPLVSQSPVILILNILTGQAKTHCTHMVLRAVPCPLRLTAILRGCEAEGNWRFYGPDTFPTAHPTLQEHWSLKGKQTLW